MKKFAPGLKVARYYGTKQRVDASTDVVITTPHTKPPEIERFRKCTRLVLDESHLYEPKADPKLPPNKILRYCAWHTAARHRASTAHGSGWSHARAREEEEVWC